MKLYVLLALFTGGLISPAAKSDPQMVTVTQADQDTLACEIFRERPDWYRAAEQTEARWGLPIAHQLAFLTTDWKLQESQVPTRWRPDWTRIDRPQPGILPGFLEATWRQYESETGNTSASYNSTPDVLDFMGWYFATLGPIENVSPYDPVAQYVLWRHGPDLYRAGAWKQNLWINGQAHRFANQTRLFMSDLEDCQRPQDNTMTSRAFRAFNPMNWRDRSGWR